MSCGNCGNGGCGGCSSGCGRVDASQIILNPVNAGVRACSPLSNTCGTGQSATPTPAYDCAPQCQENHCQEIVNNFYSAAICTQYAFNMPDCGNTASVYFIDVKSLPVGAYLWDDLAGYLEVTAFNNQTGLATLVNHCNEGNAAAGTNIPACTCFTVQAPPCCNTEDPTTPFLAADFTAPADGDCTTITVTSVAGLILGAELTLGTGIYTLDSILSPTTIIICNNGEGITPGSVVEARNAAGQLQFPLTSIGESPCTATSTSLGAVVVCNDGVQKTLSGPGDGAILTLTDSANNIAAYVNLCSAAAVSEGTVVVCDGGAPKPLEGDAEGDALVLTSVGDSTGAYITLGLVADNQETAPQDFLAINDGVTSNTTVISVNLTNTNPYKAMQVIVTASMRTALATATANRVVNYGIEEQTNGGGYTDLVRLLSFGVVTPTATFPGHPVGHTVHTIAASGSILLQYRGFISNSSGTAGVVTATTTILKVSVLGVAV